MQEIAERSPFGLAILSGRRFAVRYVNAAFCRLTTSDPDRLLGHSLVDALSPWPGGERVSEVLGDVWRTGEAQCDIEVQPASAAPAGVTCWKVTAWPVPAGTDGPRELVLHVRDATAETRQRRRLEELIAEMRAINERLVVASLHEQELAERAEEANKAKAAFLATMSHELRTPLTAVIGYEQLLEDGITGPVTLEQRRQLRRIRTSATHLLELIDGLLTLSRLEAQREVVHREPVSSSGLLDEAVTLVLPLAAAKHLEFEVEALGPSVVMQSDPFKVRQILVNLLGNAIKFTDHGTITLSAHAAGGDIVFTVHDTGIGIPPEQLERIFDPFWQAEPAMTRRSGGTGLGLSVSRRLARLLGGDLTVDSAVGIGSTFRLRLPMESGQRQTDRDAAG